jgi:hypothetical protein
LDISENWAIFIEGEHIKWTFGNLDDEFQQIVLNFIIGLGKLGHEFYGEGIASIHFDLKKHSGLKASEIFIVSLQEQFFLAISDPATTLLLINSQGGIPLDIKETMTAVLAGEASILYANMIETYPDNKETINEIFRNIILDINSKYYDNERIQLIVGKSGSNFSILAFEELLLLHFYLRKQAEETSYHAPSSWCLISHLDGGDLPFSYNMEDDVLYGGYFSAIITFISKLFESKPKLIAFGSNHIHKLRFIYGKRYFMAIDTQFMVNLLLKRQFQKKFFSTSYSVIKDLSEGIKALIIGEILQYSEEELNQLSTENLLDTYLGEASENLTLFGGNNDENFELLRNEHRNQVLRVWGRFLSEL